MYFILLVIGLNTGGEDPPPTSSTHPSVIRVWGQDTAVEKYFIPLCSHCITPVCLDCLRNTLILVRGGSTNTIFQGFIKLVKNVNQKKNNEY